MLTAEERQLAFVKLVQKMRTAQKEELATRYYAIGLENAKYYERQVDRALRMLRQRELYDA